MSTTSVAGFGRWSLFLRSFLLLPLLSFLVCPCSTSKQCNIEANYRFNCHPELIGLTEEHCLSRGCCWNPSFNSEVNGVTLGRAASHVPGCYYPSDFNSYTANKQNETGFGYTVELERSTTSYYPKDVMQLVVDVYFESKSRLHFKIYDPNDGRYEVPIDTPKVTQKANLTDYEVKMSEKPFSLAVKRKSSNITILDTSVNPAFIFSDQFIQISTKLPSNYVYGLGEHRDSLLHNIDWTSFSFWTHGFPPMENMNLYGAHPFYMVMEDNGNAHGVFLLNSNAMDVTLQPAPALTWRTIGGILDFYVFTGPTPGEVIQQYIEVIGRPFMPPYWSLGFHLCRYGYGSTNKTREVWQSMLDAKIPLDTQWNDIDSMDSSKDFTLDPQAYGDLPDFVKEIHKNKQHYVIMVDPAISNEQPKGSYPPYDDGVEMDIFIRDYKGKPFVGKVWPGHTVFPDYTNPATVEWWEKQTRIFHNKVEFDGLWNDMNEPASFVSGAVGEGCPIGNTYDYPPYVPNVFGITLNDESMCPSAKQNLSLHYNLHNLYGYTEVSATYRALKNIRGLRPFVLSRSTFSGSGKYTAHWTGDNLSSWGDLYYSIPAILNFNMFGIPMVGADICGFRGDTTEELCQRWQQLGAFYPFSRNHNDLGAKDQHPTIFSKTMQNSTRKALLVRYTLLPYLYTLFHKASIAGETVARPLFFEFPHDDKTLTIDKQFLWGEALLITPVLEKGATSVKGYFPKGIWYDYYTGVGIPSTGEQIELDTPMDKINLHIRESFIIPTQEPNTTTTTARQNPFGLLVALSKDGVANGSLYWDDGERLDSFDKKKYEAIEFSAARNVVNSTVINNGYTVETMILGSVMVCGVMNNPQIVKANGKEIEFTFDLQNRVLRLNNISLRLTKDITIQWT
ncbi:lysosomal alpha-glucosidase-like [Glandiceps talaboti]